MEVFRWQSTASHFLGSGADKLRFISASFRPKEDRWNCAAPKNSTGDFNVRNARNMDPGRHHVRTKQFLLATLESSFALPL